MRALAACFAALLLLPAIALAEESSPNVKAASTHPEAAGAISINFIADVMFVSTVEGLYSYDVSDPDAPALLDHYPLPNWENEDMDVDPVRKRIFVARDPRGFTGGPYVPNGGMFPRGGVHVLDVSDPADIRLVNFFFMPGGHTTTCVNSCDFLWTAGPGSSVESPPDWEGRPIFATDVRDPVNPVQCPEPIDLNRNDGKTDYVHDVQVDARGVAWVSGRGGVRGYWTRGRHYNPVSGRHELATACRPVPYAGGGADQASTPSRFMHNAWRNPRAKLGRRRGRVLYATEENVTADCATSGRFVTYDLTGSLKGQGWKDKNHRLRALDTWTPQEQEGTTGCASAHYFSDRGDGLLAQAFYDQGIRFLDVRNPRKIRQVGWYRPEDGQAWAAYWRRGRVYVADLVLGVTVLRFDGGSSAPPMPKSGRSAMRMDAVFGMLCPLPRRSPGL